MRDRQVCHRDGGLQGYADGGARDPLIDGDVVATDADVPLRPHPRDASDGDDRGDGDSDSDDECGDAQPTTAARRTGDCGGSVDQGQLRGRWSAVEVGWRIRSVGIDLRILGEVHPRQPCAHARLPGRADHDGLAIGEAVHPVAVDVDDIGHDDSDVVGRATRQREFDQRRHRAGGISLGEDLLHLVIAHDRGEAVTADEIAVALARLQHGEVRLDGLHAVDGAHEQRSPRVDGGLVGRDAPGVDERLHVGVVVGHLRELTVAQEVGARVSDVHHRDPVVEPVQRGRRGAHAGEVGVVGDDQADAGAG